MTALAEELRKRIRERGPMPFAAFMSTALYHPRHGYYASGAERSGWRGHFLTSPELDPAFGSLWARGFERVWEACGRPARFDVVEIGPGEGTFARAVLDAVAGAFASALCYRLVERIPALEARQRARLGGRSGVSWTRSITELPVSQCACVFANEVLDNLPVHLVEKRDGELRELCITLRGGSFEFEPLPLLNRELESFFVRVGVDLPEGHRYEVPLAAESMVTRLAKTFETGALVLVDYGDGAVDLAARPAGTLACYSETGVDDRPLERVGGKDITVHANWTAVAQAAAAAGLDVVDPRPQREVLRALGTRLLDAQLKKEHGAALREGRGVDAVRALSRRQALGALLDPGGLGGLEVLVATRGLEPVFGAEASNRA